MKRSSQAFLLMVLSLSFIALGCAASETATSDRSSAPPTTAGTTAPAPSTTAGPTVAAPTPATATKTDTIDWATQGAPLPPPPVREGDTEGLAESKGLIGPLVAVGGKRSEVYILVYDPAGVLVGALRQEEVRQNPRKLENLVAIAHARAEIQNFHAMQVMNAIALRSNAGDAPQNP